jgi:hypothetical protein
MDSVKIEKLVVFELVKKFSAFYGTRTFIAILTKFHHSSPSWSVPTLPSYFLKIHFNIILPLWMIMIMWKLWTQVLVPLIASSHRALCLSGWYLDLCVEDLPFKSCPIKEPEVRLWFFPFRSFPICRSQIILSFSGVQSEVLKALVNKHKINKYKYPLSYKIANVCYFILLRRLSEASAEM